MKSRIHLVSLGCPKNLIDSELMASAVIRNGYDITPVPQNADIIIINTCAFIQPAKEEAIDTILQMAKFKMEGTCHHLVVTGCLPQRYGAELASELPEVDLFLGTSEMSCIASHIRSLSVGKRYGGRTIISPPDFLMSAGDERILSTPSYSAYIKIAEGCSNCCSYCVVPSVRGKARSRPAEDILHEAETLAGQGVKELIVIAQDTTAYGTDLNTNPRLPELLTMLADISSLKWIRLLYTHPAGLTITLFEVIAGIEKLCPYIDMPIQHIDDAILKAMNRHVDSKHIRNVIAAARKTIPGLALRTSLIVGFPGETKKKFEGLHSFIEEIRFDHLGVFTYSKEEGTPAALLPSRIAKREKQRRRGLLMEIQLGISLDINRSLVGTLQEVLVEGTTDDPEYPHVGRCRRQAPEIDGVTYIRGGNLEPGNFVIGRIIEAGMYDLFADKI